MSETTRKREGAGRPKGSGKFGCETTTIRVPAHLVEEINDFVAKNLEAERKARTPEAC